MTLDSALLWKILLKKYPDGVDVQAVHQKTVTETTVVRPVGDDIPFGVKKTLIDTTIQLTEIEPETGIYSAMSAVTHRVYVYVDINEHGVV